jgi:Holliday junction resolvase RusA-like endonuclease
MNRRPWSHFLAEQVEIRFSVPGKPRGKQHQGARIVNAKDGRQFISHFTKPQTRSEESAIRFFAEQAMNGRPLLDGPLELHLCAYIEVPASWSNKKRRACLGGQIFPISRPDWDNYAEMMDALNLVVWTDDARVVDSHVYKRYSEKPRLSIVVKTKLIPGV